MRSKLNKPIIKFISVGVFNTLLDFGILNILVLGLNTNKFIANIVSVTCAMLASFALNKYFVFSNREKQAANQFVKFVLITGFSVLFVQNIIIYIVGNRLIAEVNWIYHFLQLESWLPISIKAFSLNIAKLSSVVVSLAFNFTMYNKYVFAQTLANEQPSTENL